MLLFARYENMRDLFSLAGLYQLAALAPPGPGFGAVVRSVLLYAALAFRGRPRLATVVAPRQAQKAGPSLRGSRLFGLSGDGPAGSRYGAEAHAKPTT